MDDLLIKQWDSVGLFKFGMNMKEVEQCNHIYIEKHGLYKDSFFFEYDEEGKLTSIHLILNEVKRHFQCFFRGIDLLNLKATDLVNALNTISPFMRDRDASMGFTYQFPCLGITFWRGNVCNEDDLETDWFKELIPENQEDEKRFLYFETITFYPKEHVFHFTPENVTNIEKIPTPPTYMSSWEKPDPKRVREIAIKLGLRIPENPD